MSMLLFFFAFIFVVVVFILCCSFFVGKIVNLELHEFLETILCIFIPLFGFFALIYVTVFYFGYFFL